LLEEWKAAEATIRNFDSILTTVRFYGTTAAIALMGAAAESLRSEEAVVWVASYPLHVAALIQSLSTLFVLVLWFLHAHYLAFLVLTSGRQRDIEKGLLVQGTEVLRLGRDITRRNLHPVIRDPWNYLFVLLLALSVVLSIIYGLVPTTSHRCW
jgi:hypothetical protein